MSKKCDKCGKQTSFLDGGSEYKGLYLCFDCYEEVINSKNENTDKLKELLRTKEEELLENKETDTSYGRSYITLLRIVAWVELIITFILSVVTFVQRDNLLAGVIPVLIGTTVFVFLMVTSWMSENIIEIRKLYEKSK